MLQLNKQNPILNSQILNEVNDFDVVNFYILLFKLTVKFYYGLDSNKNKIIKCYS